MIAWSELGVGHEQIDAQHRAIVRQLMEASERAEAEDRAGVEAALLRLWDETVGHFATEEALMEAHGYPERAAHRSSHHLFLEDLKGLLTAIREHGLDEDVKAWATQRAPEWIAFHIQANDAPLARFLARRTAARLVAGARGEPGPQKPHRRDDAGARRPSLRPCPVPRRGRES